MAYLLALVLVAYAGTVYGFLRHIQSRDEFHHSERQLLLNRIQAPQVAVNQTAPDEPPSKAFVNYDDDADLAKELERLNGDS